MTTEKENEPPMETPEPPAENQAEEREGSSWMGMLITAAIAVVITTASLTAYHYSVVLPNKQRFGMLDIAEVLQLKELEVTIKSLQASNDQQRGDAFDAISRFAKDMETAIGEIQRDCECTLLVRAAVVKSGAEDLTPLLKQKMGVDHLEVSKLIQQIQDMGGPGNPPIRGPGNPIGGGSPK